MISDTERSSPQPPPVTRWTATRPRLWTFGIGRNGTGIGPTISGARYHGTAPQARIMGYKVCGPAPQCAGDTPLSMEDAASPYTLIQTGNQGPTPVAKPVADVINLSLGDTAGSATAASARAANNAALNGTIVVASAGNVGVRAREQSVRRLRRRWQFRLPRVSIRVRFRVLIYCWQTKVRPIRKPEPPMLRLPDLLPKRARLRLPIKVNRRPESKSFRWRAAVRFRTPRFRRIIF